MDGVRYEGSMFKIDKMSQDTVHEWSIYNPDSVKPVEVQPDDLSSIFQTIHGGINEQISSRHC